MWTLDESMDYVEAENEESSAWYEHDSSYAGSSSFAVASYSAASSYDDDASFAAAPAVSFEYGSYLLMKGVAAKHADNTKPISSNAPALFVGCAAAAEWTYRQQSGS